MSEKSKALLTESFIETFWASLTISGGGNISFVSGRLKWSTQIIVKPASKSIENRYLAISCPASGSISKYDGTSVTVTADGIPLSNNHILLYRPYIAYSQSAQERFLILTADDSFTWEPDWIMIAFRDNDGIVRFGSGMDFSSSGTRYNIPAGAVVLWTSESVPTGWLECNGAAISRTDYAALFAIIGTTYGAGNGYSTFNIPDYRGKFPRGWAHGSTNDPDRTGRTNRGDGITGDRIGTNQLSAFQGHKHYFLNSGGLQTAWPVGISAGNSYVTASGGGSQSYTHEIGNPRDDGTNGSPRTSTESRPLNINTMFIIKI